MKHFLILTHIFLILAQNSWASLNIVTSTEDLASLVKFVGEDHVSVTALVKGSQDPHHIEPKPSLIFKIKKADLIVSHGLELESAWLPTLIQSARSPKLLKPEHQLELGPLLNPLESSVGSLSRAEGDIHPAGNPHFHLDPARLAKATKIIADKLSTLDEAHKNNYLENGEKLQKLWLQKESEWKNRIIKSGVTEIVSYHKSFSYFCAHFLLKCNLQLEPKPGIPPSAAHLAYVTSYIKKNKIQLVLIENIYDFSVKNKLKELAPNLKIYSAPIYVNATDDVKNSFDLIESLIKIIEGQSKEL